MLRYYSDVSDSWSYMYKVLTANCVLIRKKRISRTVNNGSVRRCPMSMPVLSYMLTKFHIVDNKTFLPLSKRFTFFILNMLYTYDTFSWKNLYITSFSLEVLTIFISFRSHWTSMVLLGPQLVTCAFKSIVFPWCVVMMVVLRFTAVESTERNTKTITKYKNTWCKKKNNKKPGSITH